MQKIIFIHRGRNQKSKDIGRIFTSLDYNFDYRGKNRVLLLLKALITSSEIPKANAYLVEGGLCMNVAFFIKLFRPNSKIVLLVLEPLFYSEGVSAISRRWIKLIVSKADGILALTPMVKEDAKAYYAGPIHVAHQHIVDINRFENSTCDLNSKNIVYVIERPQETGHIKGMDIAIKAFEIVKKKEPSAKLFLVGSGTEHLRSTFSKDSGVVCLGYKNVQEVFSKCSLILAPSRYDALLYAVPEACCTGIIPVISHKVGAKEIVEKIDKSLIIPSYDPQSYADKILKIFSMNHRQKESLSAKGKEMGKIYTKERAVLEHKRGWNAIVGKDLKI